MYTIIYYAYHLRGNYQLVGDLGYGSDEWNSIDIDARIGYDATDDEVRLMVQALLADRFDLKLHRETRELPVYLVTIAKGGAKLKPASERPMEVRIEDRHFSLPKSGCGGDGMARGRPSYLSRRNHGTSPGRGNRGVEGSDGGPYRIDWNL